MPLSSVSTPAKTSALKSKKEKLLNLLRLVKSIPLDFSSGWRYCLCQEGM